MKVIVIIPFNSKSRSGQITYETEFEYIPQIGTTIDLNDDEYVCMSVDEVVYNHLHNITYIISKVCRNKEDRPGAECRTDNTCDTCQFYEEEYNKLKEGKLTKEYLIENNNI